MKKLLSLFAFSFLAHSMGATDLYVNNSGQTGTYTTISQALAAASTGDRIFVSTLNFYDEDLAITKSITIAPTNSNSKISLAGNITIQPAIGMEVNLIGIEMADLDLATIVGSATVSNPARINILSCVIPNTLDFRDNTIRLKIFDSKISNINTRHIEIAKSQITGNLFVDLNVGGAPTDTCKIFACWIRTFQYASLDFHLHMANTIVNGETKLYAIPNYQTTGGSLIENCNLDAVSYLVSPNGTLNWSKCTIINTKLFWFSSAYTTLVQAAGSNLPFNNSILTNSAYHAPWSSYYAGIYAGTNTAQANNFNGGISSNSANWDNARSTGLYNYNNAGLVNSSKSPNVLYCMGEFPVGYFGPSENLTGVNTEDTWSTVLYNTGNTFHINEIQGHPAPSSVDANMNIWDDNFLEIFSGKETFYGDIGSPASNYIDIDLTRNDLGILGGPYSWLNYWYSDAPGKAAVFDLNFPSEIWPGQTVNLKAEGVHTN